MPRFAIRIAICAAVSATSAAAQTPAPAAAAPAGADARARLMAADADKDGKWSKAEWLAAGRREQGFAFVDADGDGLVTQAELRTGMEKAQAMRSAK